MADEPELTKDTVVVLVCASSSPSIVLERMDTGFLAVLKKLLRYISNRLERRHT